MNIEKINEYMFQKHGVIPGSQKDYIEDVSNAHLGLHSARIVTPYTTLCSRLVNYQTNMLTTQLYDEKKLIKMRCMRTTLHIVPHDIAGILHMATLDMRLSSCHLFFKKNNISQEFVQQFHDILLNFIKMPTSSAQIEKEMLKYIKFESADLRKECSKKILKYYWEMGLLCYVNVAENWEKEERRYAVTKRYYPELKLERHSKSEAQDLLILMYLEKFGPATLKDITWWSGLSTKIVRNIIERHSDSVTNFYITDSSLEFYITRKELEKLKKYKVKNDDWVNLLAFEDPALKGYFETRFRYVNANYYNQLFNQIGEVRASIIHNGKAIGIWTWDKKRKKINLDYFTSVDTITSKKVEDVKKEFEAILAPNNY